MYKNFLTGIEYTNSNWDTLAESGFSNPNFLTYKQAQTIGRQVRRGEKGIELKRVVIKKVKNKLTNEIEEKRIIKKFWVFNVEQTDVVDDAPQVEPVAVEPTPETITFQYCEEQREAMNETNDCTVKALAISANMAYKEAHSIMKKAGRRNRRGMHTPSIKKGFELAGFKLEKVKHTAKTVGNISQDCAKSKSYVATTARHILAITNATVQDWTDGRRHRIQELYEVVKA